MGSSHTCSREFTSNFSKPKISSSPTKRSWIEYDASRCTRRAAARDAVGSLAATMLLRLWRTSPEACMGGGSEPRSAMYSLSRRTSHSKKWRYSCLARASRTSAAPRAS